MAAMRKPRSGPVACGVAAGIMHPWFRRVERMSLEQLKKDVAAAVDGMRAELLELSHAIHQEPELALEEFKAAKRLSDAVASHDLPVTREAFGVKTAYASEFGKDSRPVIAVLSESNAVHRGFGSGRDLFRQGRARLRHALSRPERARRRGQRLPVDRAA